MYGSLLSEISGGFSLPIKTEKRKHQELLSSQTFAEYGFPVPCNEGWGERLYTDLVLAYLRKADWRYVPNDTWPHHIRCEAYRFYMCFLAYYESSNPIIPPLILLSKLKDEAQSIVWLKKVKAFCLAEAMGGWFQDVDPEDATYYEDSKAYRMIDIGDFFNVRFWVFFDQPNPHDEEAMFIPLKQDESKLKKFREVAEAIIPVIEIENIQEEEVLLDISSSSSILGEKTVPLWYAKNKENYFSNKPLVGKGSYIQKCPGDTRFAIVLSAPHSNSVKLIEKQLALLAAEMPWSCYTKDNDEFSERFQSLDKLDHFFNRDIKKDGLTKNRKLVQIVLDVIKKKYPHWKCGSYFGIYDNFYCIIDGVKKCPPRGVGLGMSSAITTIIQSIVFRMNLDDLIDLDEMVGNVDALFYHDDATFGSDDENTLENLKDIDFRNCTALGMIPAVRKSFTAKSYVLCENYSDPILGTKESYQRSVLKTLHASVNTTHAKFNWLSMYRYTDPVYWPQIINELYTHFGYEFYEQEIDAPTLLGGWVPAVYMGVDISLYSLDRDLFKTELAASMVGSDTSFHFKEKRKFPGDFVHPIKKIFPFAKNFGRRDIFFSDYTNDQVNSHLCKFNKEGLTTSYWKHQSTYRWKLYRSYRDGEQPLFHEWIDRMRSIHPNKDILPPKRYLRREDVTKFPECKKVFTPENSRLSYLKALNPGALPDKIIAYPLPPGSGRPGLRLTAFERIQAKYESHFFDRGTYGLQEMQIHVPTNRAIYSREWLNPMAVIAFISAVEYEEYLPVFKDRPDIVGDMSEEYFYKLNSPTHGNLYPYLVGRLGQIRVDRLDLTYFLEELGAYIQKKRLETLKNVYKTVIKQARSELSTLASDDIMEDVSDFSWTDASLHDSDFFTWRTSKRNYTNWRNHFFNILDQVVSNMEIDQAGTMNQFDYDETDVANALEGVELHLYLSSGGKVNDLGIPILNRPSSEGEIDIFQTRLKNDNDSDSGGSGSLGLMVGF